MFKDQETSEFLKGGSTLTIVHKIVDINGELNTIVYNLGDSPCIRINETDLKIDVTEISEDQNCDSKKWYEKYCNSCLKINEEPSNIILNRFNYKGKGRQIPWVNGGKKPIHPFKKEIIDGKYIVTDNVDIMKQFYEDVPEEWKMCLLLGGSQSIRGKRENIEELKKGNYPMKNFGSTLEGIIQNLFVFGDKEDKETMHISCEPHIDNYKSDINSYEFVGSDGCFDVLKDEDITNIFSISKENHIINRLIKNKINVNAKNAFYKFDSDTKLGSWDDVSYWVIKSNK